MTQRTDVLTKPVSDAVHAALTSGPQAIDTSIIPIGKGERPKDSRGNLIDPPYAFHHNFPGGELDGPLADSQADAVFRWRIAAAGKTEDEALNVSDACTKRMHKEYISITDRKVRSVKRLASTDGSERDDDVATPIFFHVVIWEIDTTPA